MGPVVYSGAFLNNNAYGEAFPYVRRHEFPKPVIDISLPTMLILLKTSTRLLADNVIFTLCVVDLAQLQSRMDSGPGARVTIGKANGCHRQ